MSVTGLPVLGFVPLQIPDYRVGETARVEVVTPVQISAIDPVQTGVLRERELDNVHIVYRLDTNVAERAVKKFNVAWTSYKSRFVNDLEKIYGRTRLSAEDSATPGFEQFTAEFRKQHAGFPLMQRLATLWATGEDEAPVLSSWSSELQRSAHRHVRPPNVATLRNEGPRQARIIPLAAGENLALTKAVTTSGYFFAKTNFTSVARETRELQTRLKSEWIGNYIAAFLEPNCFLDESLTAQARSNRLASIWSITTFQPGQTIVRAGQVIDPKTKLLLDDLRSRLAEQQLRDGRSRQAAAASIAAPQSNPDQKLLVAAIGACLLLLLSFLRRLIVSPAPIRPFGNNLPALAGGTEHSLSFKQHLARLLADTMVHRLIWQRRKLLETQSTAAEQTALLEKQVDAIESNVQSRFAAYEQRIARLEQELAAAEEQNRDLIRAKITLAKEELETERQKNRLTLN